MDKVTPTQLALELAGTVSYILFTKKNGEEREMICTRSPKWIPHEHAPAAASRGARKVEDSDTAVPVFDLVINEWRSVCPDSIQEQFTIDDKDVEPSLFNIKQERENT